MGQEIKINDVRLVICDRCKGEGVIEVATGDSERCRKETCPQCDGKRVMKRILTITYQPLNKNEH